MTQTEIIHALHRLRSETKEVLLRNILPFWLSAADLENGGFLGQVTGENKPVYDAPKGAILNARLLWTFSACSRTLHDPLLADYAQRAKQYLVETFTDHVNGGIYWLVDHQGTPLNTKKQIYAQAFALYGLSEHYRATADADSLERAVTLFQLIERYSFDPVHNGYFEAFDGEWKTLADMRLSEKDANESKTMNTHLHLLEAYTCLYRVWKSPELADRLKNLIELFFTRFFDPKTGHFRLFFTTEWKPVLGTVSYGHDIEASWLLHEAAEVLEDEGLIKKTEDHVRTLAGTCREGLQPDGSLIYEFSPEADHRDTERHWWVQAETVVGYLNAFGQTRDPGDLSTALRCWEYIKKRLIDHDGGEWFWSIRPDGTVNRQDDKLGIWKCPYHNSRMCLEIIERASELLKNE